MKRNVPSLPVTLTRVPCSEGLEASTVTPGSGRPSVPITVPVISPVVCARMTGAIRRRQTDSTKLNRKADFIPSSLAPLGNRAAPEAVSNRIATVQKALHLPCSEQLQRGRVALNRGRHQRKWRKF